VKGSSLLTRQSAWPRVFLDADVEFNRIPAERKVRRFRYGINYR